MADFRDQLWNYIDSVLPSASPDLKQKLLEQVGQAIQKPSQSPAVAGVLGMTGEGPRASFRAGIENRMGAEPFHVPQAGPSLNVTEGAAPTPMAEIGGASSKPPGTGFTMGEGSPPVGPPRPNFKMVPGEQPGQAVVPKADAPMTAPPMDLPSTGGASPYGEVPTDPSKVGSWWQGLSPKQKIGVLTTLGAGGAGAAKVISDQGSTPAGEAGGATTPVSLGGAGGSASPAGAGADNKAPTSKNPIPDDHHAPATQTFSQAFASARKSGRPIFEWNGKHYNTKVAHHAIKAREGARAPDRRGPMPGDTSADALNGQELERLHGQAG